MYNPKIKKSKFSRAIGPKLIKMFTHSQKGLTLFSKSQSILTIVGQIIEHSNFGMSIFTVLVS